VQATLPTEITNQTENYSALRRFLRSGWAAFGFFLVASVIFTYPLIFRLSDSLPDWGDAADSSWRIGTLAQNLRTNPLDLYHTRAFYPIQNGLALDELLTGQGLLAAPVIWLTDNPPLGFNLLLFFSYVLSGFSMWLLVRHLTGSTFAGIAAGLIYAFSPWHYSHHGHLGLSSQHWMIFALYFLIRFNEQSQIRRSLPFLVLFALSFWLQAIVAGYYAYFGAMLIGFYLLYYFAFEKGILPYLWQKIRRRNALAVEWRLLRNQFVLMGVASFGALLLIIPFVYPFIKAQSEYSFRRDLREASYWSAAPTSLLRTDARSWLYKPVQNGIFDLQTSAERALYPGIIAVLLALFGLFAARYWGKRWLFAAISLFGLVLSFGPYFFWETYNLKPTGIPLPYLFFYQYVPGFDALRVPHRFGQLFMLGLAVCAGFGVAALVTRLKGKSLFHPASLALLLIPLLITADYIAPNVPIQPTPTGQNMPQPYNWLQSADATKIIGRDDLLLQLPMGTTPLPVNTMPIHLMYGLYHDRPMLNGSANIIPSGYGRLYREMQSFPNPSTLDIIEGLGVKFLVVHWQGLPAEANRAELSRQVALGRLELVQELDNPDARYNIYRVIPNPARFAELSRALPEGATVLLTDDRNGNKLYTAVLPRLLGSKAQYVSDYRTIYAALPGNNVQPYRTPQYAIFYRNEDLAQTAARYKLLPAQLEKIGGNEVIDLYRVQ
jgi:hypothetical protein